MCRLMHILGDLLKVISDNRLDWCGSIFRDDIWVALSRAYSIFPPR